MKVASFCSLVLVLVLVSLGEAQKKARRAEPPVDGGCACYADGANCLFGHASGCYVHCSGDTCSCTSAYCRFGFPFGASCHC